MNEEVTKGVHWSFWLVVVVSLLWNIGGIMAYLGELDADTVAAMDPAYRALVESRPAWATAAFAIAVWGGALGCLVLLSRRSEAFYLFVASLLGIIVQMYYNLVIAESTVVYGPGQVAMTVMIPVVALFLIWYSKFAVGKAWVS